MSTNVTFIGSNNVTCNRNTLNTELPIPNNISCFVMTGQGNDLAMATCCFPNPLHVVNSCYVWCELPQDYYVNRTDYPTEDSVGQEFESCLRSNHESAGAFKVYLTTSAAPRVTNLGKMALAAWLLCLFAV